MSFDLTVTDADKLYDQGYDDGHEGRAKRFEDPYYLDGWYMGDSDADEEDSDDDFYDGYYEDYDENED